jgi:hypothetical protein
MYSRRPWTRLDGDPSFLALCRDFYTRSSGQRSTFVGTLFVGFGTLARWKYASTSTTIALINALVVLVGLGSLLAAPYQALRVKIAFKRGRPALAEVISLNDITRSRVTLDALTNGWTEGVRVVQTTPVPFNDDFATDEPGARDIKPGSMMRVLVHAQRPEVLVELGLDT